MKKIFLLSLVSLFSLSAFSQTGGEKVEFNKHWFGQIQGGIGYTVGESSNFGDLVSGAGALSVGYQFTPTFGLRANVSGWQGKGSWPAFRDLYKFNYAQLAVDAMFNLNQIFGSKNLDPVVSTYIFAGVGVNNAFNNEEAVSLAAQDPRTFSKTWSGNLISPAGHVGVGADFRLSKCLALNIEVNADVLSDKFNSKNNGGIDVQCNGLIGLTINFGPKTKTVSQPVEVYEAPAVVEEPAEEPVAQEPAKPVVAPVVAVEPLKEDLEFKINSAVINASEEAKIADLVSYMNEHKDSKVTVTGYADKETGNSTYNMSLSKKRAEAVAKAIEAKGISSDRVVVDYKGDTVQPFSTAAQNRVVICVAE